MSGVLRATSADITTVNATDVNATSVDATPAKPGQIIEYLSRPCDGGNLVGQMGTFPTAAVNAVQNSTSTWVDVTGSVISYQPPPGATTIIYRFYFHHGHRDANCISSFSLFLGGAEITHARIALQSYTYYNERMLMEWPVTVGEQDDITNGHILSWDTPLEFKMQYRDHNTSYQTKVHAGSNFAGTGDSSLIRPTITLIAIV